MTDFAAGFNAGKEAAVKRMEQWALISSKSEHANLLRECAFTIRSLPVPEAEAGEDEAALMAAITAYKRERYGKWWPNGDTTEGVRDMELRAMQAALRAARGQG